MNRLSGLWNKDIEASRSHYYFDQPPVFLVFVLGIRNLNKNCCDRSSSVLVQWWTTLFLLFKSKNLYSRGLFIFTSAKRTNDKKRNELSSLSTPNVSKPFRFIECFILVFTLTISVCLCLYSIFISFHFISFHFVWLPLNLKLKFWSISLSYGFFLSPRKSLQFSGGVSVVDDIR